MGATATEPANRDGLLPDQPVRKVQRPRGSGKILLAAGIATVLLGGIAGAVYFAPEATTDGIGKYKTKEAVLGNLVVTITEDGNAESASNIELRCEVTGGSTILEIVDDGILVKKGDVLVRLDSSPIEDEIYAQRILVSEAKSMMIQAENNLSAATIAVDEYIQGTFVQELQTAESNITIAEENLRSAENLLQHIEKMARRNYVTPLQLEQQQFAVKRAKLDMALQEKTKEVLEVFTKPKMVEELQAARDSAAASLESKTAAYELEQRKLERLEQNMEKSTIIAPQDGMVVYANDRDGRRGGDQGPSIAEGATVREFQPIIRLPDLAAMQVKTTVHESKIERVRPGMPAVITVQGRQYRGSVAEVASQPESGNFWGGNVKQYPTIVAIVGQHDDLKPGMTAEVKIQIARVTNAILIPVQCVVEMGGKFYAWVDTPTGPESRELVLGDTNDRLLEIKQGLNVGDMVILNPRASLPEARQAIAIEPVPAEIISDDAAGDIASDSDVGSAVADQEEPTDAATADDTQTATDDELSDVDSAEPVDADANAEDADSEQADDVDQARESGGPASGGPAEGGPGARGGREGGGGRGGRGGMQIPSFASLDADQDGSVSMEEYPEEGRQFFSRIDTDGDGSISKAEYDEMQKRMREMMQRFQQQGGGGGGPPGGGGRGGF